MTTGSLLVVAYAIASRLAYVGWVGVALRRQECDQYFTKRDGVEPGYRRFRRRAEWIMRNDALAIVLACIVTRDTLHLAVPRTILLAVAAILIAIGLGTKMWAARTLGDNAYYWHNFFSSDMHEPPDPPGPFAPVPPLPLPLGSPAAWLSPAWLKLSLNVLSQMVAVPAL